MKRLFLALLLLLGLAINLCATDPWQEPEVLTGSMCVMAHVRINGLDAASGDVLAAFVDVDGEPELRGKAAIQVLDGTAGCLIQIYTEADEEMIRFRVWDDSAEQIYDDPIYLASEVEGLLGDFPDNMYPVNTWETPVADPWPNPQILPGSMIVMARVNICDQEAADGDILAAFVNVNGIDVLKGKASVQVIEGIAGCLIQVFTQTAGEQIHFKVWDVDAQQVYSDARLLSSEIDTALGSYPNSLYYINAGGIIQQVATPLISPESGLYTTAQTVVISCTIPSAIIRFSTDGSDPDEEDDIYTAPITVPLQSSLQIKAKAYLSGWMPSLISSASYTVTGQVTDPVFSPPPGNYNASIHVTMQCSTPGASIHYTTNGLDPSPDSPQYENPIQLPMNSQWNFRAKAFLDGWEPSNTVSAVYNIPGTVATPDIAPPAGTYTEPITVSMICGTDGAQIYYTTDGSEPSMASPLYTAPVNVFSSSTIKAKAFKQGLVPSSTITAQYVITGTVATPSISPPTGTYTEPITVSMICSTQGAQIYYTTNGSEPSMASTPYTMPVSVSSSCTIKAKAFKQGWIPSSTITAHYVITGTVATPSFAPPPGQYQGTVYVQISCSTPNSQIHYTLNGGNPDIYSDLYTVPLEITENCTIKARAFLDYWIPSPIATAEYEIVSAIPDTPPLPSVTGIQNLYPNPFSKSLTIQLGIKEREQDYRLAIYNLRGECVWQRRGTAKGSFELFWDGCSNGGARMPAGVYLLSFTSGSHRSLRKVLLK